MEEYSIMFVFVLMIAVFYFFQFWYFSIHYRHDSQRQYDLRCDTEGEVNAWVDAIKHCK